jgi:hypothetical protein
MSDLPKERLIKTAERALEARMLGEHFEKMKERIAYLDFQEN